MSTTRKKLKDKPILFSCPMVPAILSGQKTQTRRVVKPQPKRIYGFGEDEGRIFLDCERIFRNRKAKELGRIYCPYGTHGTHLWVRETWKRHDETLPDGIMYRADNTLRFYTGDETEAAHGCKRTKSWRPAIYMPKWASRITLRVTDIRVERLQDITEEDAEAEGCKPSQVVEMKDGSPCFTEAFIRLWTSINGIDNPKSWDSNPWVWVISFHLI